MSSHDHNFKNVLMDFPREALAWVLSDIPEHLGKIQGVEFVRQEPKKRSLSDRHLALDMPILFTFEHGRVLLWLVEFQEDKKRFSIYKLLRYVTDLMEQYSNAMVIPTVLFTARRKWRKDVPQKLDTTWGNRTLLHFEYILLKIFDLNARDYYNVSNPVVKILLPKMNYAPEERFEVIRQAYMGLFELTAPMLFDKYLDFIDIYAEIREEEREELFREMTEKEETVMLAQYIRDKGFQEGKEKGWLEGQLLGRQEGRLVEKREFLKRLLVKRFGPLPEWGEELLSGASAEQLDRWADRLLDGETIQEVLLA